MTTSDLVADRDKVERMRKRAEVASIEDASPVRIRKPVAPAVEHPVEEVGMVELLRRARAKVGKT